jgi:fructosamine-3-kinase
VSLAEMQARIEAALGCEITVSGHISGGSICHAATLESRQRPKREWFLKWAAGAPEGLFSAEAEGLAALRATGTVRVPEVCAIGADFLVLELVRNGRRPPGFAERLGRELAALHRHTAPRWGFDADGFCGLTPQPNGWMDGWVDFFRERRLGPQLRLLERQGRMTQGLARSMSRLQDHLGDLLELASEPPALIHGDLWGGNFMVGPGGEPVLIDPAVSYSCREADLAMTELFGGFPAGFLAAYQEAWPLEPGYADRRDLYNLYHVLNHANLFGGSYVAQAEQIARRYAGS